MANPDESEDAGEEQVALARERTRLARERTALAHIRTGFASFLFGAALLGLFDTTLADYAAWFFIAVGGLFLITSGISYLFSQRRRTRQQGGSSKSSTNVRLLR